MGTVAALLKILPGIFVSCGLAIAIPANGNADRSESARECRERVDSLFRAQTPAKEREIANCIAESDPDSREARAAREASQLEAAAHAESERQSKKERGERGEREEAEARARCGGALVQAFGPLYFCDSPEAVERKVAETEAIACIPAGDCDRMKVTAGPLSLMAYPKYFRGGLYRISFYAPEQTASEYVTALRWDWDRLVTLVEAEYGAGSSAPLPYPKFFAVDGAHFVYTHDWDLGRMRVRVGLFEDGETYTAIMTVEDHFQRSRKERDG